jgi:hypothetical protein
MQNPEYNNEKNEIYHKLKRLECEHDLILTKNYTVDDDINEMEYEFERQLYFIKKKERYDTCKQLANNSLLLIKVIDNKYNLSIEEKFLKIVDKENISHEEKEKMYDDLTTIVANELNKQIYKI